jgi:signal transduction histidine kinase
MAGKLNTISARVVLATVLINATLLTALFFGLFSVVERNLKDVFVDDARIYARIFTDFLETEGRDSSAEIKRHLDSGILGGSTVYVALLVKDKLLMSSLMDAADAELFNEDFEFGEHGDDTYYISAPFDLDGSTAVMRLGFDEQPMREQLDRVKRFVIFILLAFMAVSVVFSAVGGAQLVRPMHRLQQVSREIASGDYSRKLEDKSKLFEISELAHDFEIMRSKLVGINAQLQREIVEREAAEGEQRTLEARLRHAHRLESIGTLAGGIAHEFNNVLTPIVLYTDLALEDIPETSAARSKLERVMGLAQRAKGLSQQILTFSSQAGEADRVAVDIAPVVEEALTLVRALIPATVEMQADVQYNLGLVLCDASQVQQLIVNLCSNAFRSLPAGVGQIQVCVSREMIDEDFAARHPGLFAGEYVALAVSDSGEGMDEATMARIFEPFFTTQEVGSGTGLGLSVVHCIVTKHDGGLSVSSMPGRGSRFCIYFPLAGRQSLNEDQESGGRNDQDNCN